MKVIVYVEGPSDRLAMRELLSTLLSELQAAGVSVEFISTDGKNRLMDRTPAKAANILLNDPESVVIAMPDLYPPHVVHRHSTFTELRQILKDQLIKELQLRGATDTRLHDRFLVFCFKHDLEALVLAAEKQLASRLGVRTLARAWIVPVEDQDHNKPPKRIVERLFVDHGGRYQDTIDAPFILGAANYIDIAEACPQCFGPFVEYLESLGSQP